MDANREIKSMEAMDFAKNNGTVMRVILTCHKRGWFGISSLAQTLDAYRLSLDDIMDAVDYFDDMNYIEVRDISTKDTVKACDRDYDEIEIRLYRRGKLVARGIEEDEGISL